MSPQPVGWVVAVGASRPRPAGLLATVREGRHGRDESGRYGRHAWIYIVDGWVGRVRLYYVESSDE